MVLLCAGLRSRSRDRSWSPPDSTVLAGVGDRAGVGKSLLTATPTGVAGCHPVTDNNFGRTGKHRREIIERRTEKGEGQCGDKVRGSCSDKIRFEKGVWDIVTGPS